MFTRSGPCATPRRLRMPRRLTQRCLRRNPWPPPALEHSAALSWALIYSRKALNRHDLWSIPDQGTRGHAIRRSCDLQGLWCAAWCTVCCQQPSDGHGMHARADRPESAPNEPDVMHVAWHCSPTWHCVCLTLLQAISECQRGVLCPWNSDHT
jgi:hypothetical protein